MKKIFGNKLFTNSLSLSADLPVRLSFLLISAEVCYTLFCAFRLMEGEGDCFARVHYSAMVSGGIEHILMSLLILAAGTALTNFQRAAAGKDNDK